MHIARHRLLALCVICLLPSCETASQSVTADPSRPSIVLNSAPVGGGTLSARWQQAFSAPGSADAYLYAPGDSASACHLTSGTGGIDFHCEGHAGAIVVTGVDPARPHTVTITLLREENATALTITQDGRVAPQSRGRVPGTPDIPDGGRLRLQVETSGGAEVRLSGFSVN